MKSIFIVLFLLISLAKGLLPDDDKMEWTPDVKLKWSDFHAQLDNSAKEVALLNGGIKFSFYRDNDTMIKVTAYAYCDRSKSTKTADVKWLTDYILNHEQGHFDLWELYARMFKKGLIDSGYTDKYKILAFYRKVYSEANKEEDKYDSETNHSINTAEQNRWSNYIAQQLKEYSAYAASEIQLRIKK